MDSPSSIEKPTIETSSRTVMAADDREDVGFLTLPREIRDRVYLSVVVAEDPIQYDEGFGSLSRSKTFANTAMKWMFGTESNPQIARETRETFYQYNTFLIYTHDISALLEAKVHAMSFRAGKGVDVDTTVYSTPFEAGIWVRNIAVRVGWHTSGGWFPDACCRVNPGEDLRALLEWNSLRSVIIDARFGSWSYGYPQGIGWVLLREMNTKWGKDFKIYNDQRFPWDTRRYTSDRHDLTDRWLPENMSSQEMDEVDTASESSEHDEGNQSEEAELSVDSETLTEEDDEEENGEDDEEEEEQEKEQEEARIHAPEDEAEENPEQDEEAVWSEEEK